MKQLDENALLVHGRIYTHRRYYYVSENKGYSYDSPIDENEPTPIPVLEWQLLCDVVNSGYCTLKATDSMVINGQNYMRVLPQKSSQNPVVLKPLSELEISLIQSAFFQVLYYAIEEETQKKRLYLKGRNLVSPPPPPFTEADEATVESLIQKGLLCMGPQEWYNHGVSMHRITQV